MPLGTVTPYARYQSALSKLKNSNRYKLPHKPATIREGGLL